MHISHHKDSSCQGQRGPRFFLSVDYKHTRRWPARPVYPQMAAAAWRVWKVSVTPARPLCRRVRLCQTGTLARTQQVDVGTANPRGSVCRPGGSFTSAGEDCRETHCNYKWVLNICCVVRISNLAFKVIQGGKSLQEKRPKLWIKLVFHFRAPSGFQTGAPLLHQRGLTQSHELADTAVHLGSRAQLLAWVQWFLAETCQLVLDGFIICSFQSPTAPVICLQEWISECQLRSKPFS